MKLENRVTYITSYQEYLDNWESVKDRLPLYFPHVEIRCKFCQAQSVIRYGYYKNRQRWWCKECRRKFVFNGALPGMKTPFNQIESALKMYYSGGSVNAIRRRLDRDFGNYPSDSTLYRWVYKFTQKTIEETRKYFPKVGDAWVLAETPIKIGVRQDYLVGVLDTKTLFLLSAKLSQRRGRLNTGAALDSAAEKARKMPQIVMVEKFKDGERKLNALPAGADQPASVTPWDKRQNPEIVENWQVMKRIIRQILRRFDNEESAQLIIDGWANHYNFFRPNELLAGRTPAASAGIAVGGPAALQIGRGATLEN
jgi:putative transposase